MSYRVGAPIALPTTQPAPAIAPGDALAFRTTWDALSRMPKGLQPILAEATLIAAPRAADPLLAAGQMSRGAQIVRASDVAAFLADVDRGKFGQHAKIAASDAALPPGVTATFSVSEEARRIEVDLHRPLPAATTAPATTTPADAVQLSLALDETGAQRERLLLAPKPMPPPSRFAVVLPSHFSSPKVKAIVAIVELQPPSDSPDHQQAVAACVEQLQRLAGAGGTPSSAAAATANDWPGLAASLRAMNEPATSRVAMVYLASQTGAELFGDTALVAPDPVLAELAARVQHSLGDSPKAMEPAQLGWLLDAATMAQLAALQSSEKMPPELAGVLARYAGEAARNAGSLDELMRVRGRDQLRSRLIAENFTYLEDTSPSARVRAYDWLKSHGRAPAKYDPLGPPRERSAAIDAAMTAAAASAAAAKTPPTKATTGGAP
jgi:hypothetical protein